MHCPRRGVNTNALTKNDMIKALQEMHDFKTQKTIVEELITRYNHRCIFLP